MASIDGGKNGVVPYKSACQVITHRPTASRSRGGMANQSRWASTDSAEIIRIDGIEQSNKPSVVIAESIPLTLSDILWPRPSLAWGPTRRP